VLNIPSPPDIHEPETAFLDDTSQIYEHVFGEGYAVCLCWPCVDGRRADDPGSWRLKWFTGPVSRTRISEEMHRRRCTTVDIPLVFVGKQCRKCGSHPRRHCRKKDIVERLEQEPLLLGRSITGRVSTPAASVAASPGPRGRTERVTVPFRDPEISPVRSETLCQTPSQSFSPSTYLETSEPTLWDTDGDTIMELHDSNRSRPPTPGLTDGSTCSGYSSDEAAHSNYTVEGCANLCQTPPRTNNRNADAARDGPRGRSRISRVNGPEPGEWLAGQTW
jgi:hypothetical protein